MKKYLFMFLLLALPISLIIANPTDSRRMIQLKVKKKVVHRSIEVSPVDAFVTGSLLEISFNCPFKEATITVLNNKTGEQVYYTQTRDNLVIIDLQEYEGNTEYSLNLLLDQSTFINGEFEIE